MNAGIEAAAVLKPKPDAIIVLTDGYTPWPQKPIAIPTVFGILHFGKTNFPHPPIPPWTPDQIIGINLA